MSQRGVRGVIFDLDGTLVDSGLDFRRIRRELGIESDRPILEAIDDMSPERATRCRQILARYEDEGARRATPMPHVAGLLAALAQCRCRQAVLTRNRRSIAEDTVARMSWRFDPVLGREDAPVKPDPSAIHLICERWELQPHEVVVIGDYRFDIDAGRNAGARTVLYTRGRDPPKLEWSARADYVLDCYSRHADLLRWLLASV